jgi:glutamate-1-semialdehyde aminotransferase
MDLSQQNLDPNAIYLLMGGIGMLASALGSLMTQGISAWLQKRQLTQQISEGDKRLNIDRMRADTDVLNQQLATSTTAVAQTFGLLTECMAARSMLQAEVRAMVISNTKTEVRINKIISDIQELVDEIAEPHSCENVRNKLIKIIDVMKQNGGTNGNV